MRAREVLSRVGSKAGLAVVGGALLLTGVGFGAAAASGAIGTQPASDVSTVTTPAADPTSSAPTTTPAPAPVATSSVAPTTAATVAPVTSAQQSEPTPAPSAGDGVGTTGPDGVYTPAPPPADIGGGAIPLPPPPQLPPAPKMPGEPGYESPSS